MDFVLGLPFGYLFGLPIVLVMWLEDWFLSDKIGLGMKVATSACVGYVASIAMQLPTSALHLQLPQIPSGLLVLKHRAHVEPAFKEVKLNPSA